ncbi:PqqF [Methyloligella halotolerans]|uniref:PqqF n=1 Tax=Methyloligella halotolerans TaxID=1177755 RepID=A0A1E2RYD1_9HYPH|nr:pitrilysin family protein [Methyloligella halotolerans]ODA67237.1 PqqF [Methyloligella halotolerans]
MSRATDRSSVPGRPAPEVSRLSNGLTVASITMPGVETVSLGIWVGAGSRSETASEHGIAHFLEHMAFKGTARRSARDIAEEIEAVGGDINAATGVDSTAYYARVLPGDSPLALDILSDILLNPGFAPDELERERGVILQEIAASLDSPEDTVFDLAQEAAYPAQPLGRPILGTMQSIGAFARDDLSRYLGAHYHAPSMVLAAAGAIEHADLVQLAEQRLSELDATPAPTPEDARYGGGIRHSERYFEQSHLVMGFEAPALHHPEYIQMQMLAGALGGGMSSRLFQEVREKRGLCYAVYSFAHSLADTGTFSVYAATGPEYADELFAVIRDEIRRAADDGFHPDELARVKAQAKMGLFASLESSGARAEQLARHILLYGRPLSTEELLEKVEAVTEEDLRRQAVRLLTSPLTLATVGPIANRARFDGIAEEFVLPPSKAA